MILSSIYSKGIYTSYYKAIYKLPKFLIPISISNTHPRYLPIMEYPKLSPGYEILNTFKTRSDKTKYIYDYNEKLNKLDPVEVVNELYQLVPNLNSAICLMCYEKPGDFCHRHIVEEWLNDSGFNCCEWHISDPFGLL